MDWTFRVRGKLITLTRLEGVVAIRAREKGWRDNRVLARLGGEIFVNSPRGLFGSPPAAQTRRELRQLHRNGWFFLEPNEEVERAAVSRTGIDPTIAVHLVYLSTSGRVVVGTDRVVVQAARELPELELRRQFRSAGLPVLRRLCFAPNLYLVRLPAGPSVEELIAGLQDRSRGFRFAEPEFLEVMPGRMRTTDAPVCLDDPDYPQQWHHRKICSEGAWKRTRGRTRRRAVRLAMVDTGFQVSHLDLAAGIVGGGYFTADGSGGDFIPFRRGMTGFPGDDRTNLQLGKHGTFCLGLAGARMNNGIGGRGSAPQADLLPIAIPDDSGTSQVMLARAFAYAADPRCEQPQTADRGADVISCSLGGDGPAWELQTVLDLAINFATSRGRGAPLLWAVPNAVTDLSLDQVCSHPRVIAVGQTDDRDVSATSAVGPKLDLVAPGESVYSATSSVSRDGFSSWSGTSFATALTAGVAALVVASHPHWTREQVRRKLRESCDKVGGRGITYTNGHNNKYGYGRINADHATS